MSESEDEEVEEEMFVYTEFPDLDRMDVLGSSHPVAIVDVSDSLKVSSTASGARAGGEIRASGEHSLSFAGLFGEHPKCEIDGMSFRGTHVATVGSYLVLGSDGSTMTLVDRAIEYRLKSTDLDWGKAKVATAQSNADTSESSRNTETPNSMDIEN